MKRVEKIKIIIGICLAGMVMWAIFVRPNSFDWQSANDAQGVVVTIAVQPNPYYGNMSYAVIELTDGRLAKVKLPELSDVVEGDVLLLLSEEDKNNTDRRRYHFKRKLTD